MEREGNCRRVRTGHGGIRYITNYEEVVPIGLVSPTRGFLYSHHHYYCRKTVKLDVNVSSLTFVILDSIKNLIHYLIEKEIAQLAIQQFYKLVFLSLEI